MVAMRRKRGEEEKKDGRREGEKGDIEDRQDGQDGWMDVNKNGREWMGMDGKKRQAESR